MKSTGNVTLKQVARRADVSVMTVSRVLNGVAGSKVGAETAARVREVAEAMGYEPNHFARGLRGESSRVIGVVVADPANFVWAEFARAVELEARKRAYSTLLMATEEDPEIELRQLATLRRRQVDGVLLVPAARRKPGAVQQSITGAPLVAVDRPLLQAGIDSVVVNNREAALGCTRHLIGHGHRKVAFVGYGPNLYTVRERAQGYSEAMRAAGLEPRLEFAPVMPSYAVQVASDMLSGADRPTAVFAMNSHIVLGLLTAARHLGLRIPEDLAIAGFEDFEWAEFVHPPLTLVRQPAEEIGISAAKLLFSRIDGEAPGGARQIVLTAPLIVRQSCGCQRS